MSEIEELEKRIRAIEERNQRVERDKAWETSLMRRVLVAGLTYGIVVLFFFIIRTEQPLLNALVPTLGFLLSTLTLDAMKKAWLRRNNA
ncbi:MAG TPA: hypothetical protein PKL83_00840 [bacterium]|nr:hypothetical protein [bacterium]